MNVSNSQGKSASSFLLLVYLGEKVSGKKNGAFLLLLTRFKEG